MLYENSIMINSLKIIPKSNLSKMLEERYNYYTLPNTNSFNLTVDSKLEEKNDYEFYMKLLFEYSHDREHYDEESEEVKTLKCDNCSKLFNKKELITKQNSNGKIQIFCSSHCIQ